MFFANSKKNSVEAIQLAHMKNEMEDFQKRLRELEHNFLKQDGYIRSLRGLVNRMRGMEYPKEEDIKTTDPTRFLKEL